MGRSSGGAAVAGSVIGYTSYGPSSQAIYNAASALAAIDSTNLNLSFIAPPSGKVRVTASLLVILAASLTAGDSNNVQLAFVDHPNGAQVSPRAEVVDVTAASTTTTQYTGVRVAYEVVVAGLTAGTAYQWDLGWLYGGNVAPAYVNGFADDGTTGANNSGPAMLTAYVAA